MIFKNRKRGTGIPAPLFLQCGCLRFGTVLSESSLARILVGKKLIFSSLFLDELPEENQVAFLREEKTYKQEKQQEKESRTKRRNKEIFFCSVACGGFML